MLDVVIIGAGPAGGSAAIFVAKAGKKVVVIDNDKGLTRRAWLENHYGTEALSGPDLLAIGRSQAEKFGAVFVDDRAMMIEATADGLQVKTEQDNVYEAKHVIIASGFGMDVVTASGIETAPGREPKVATVVSVDSDGRTSMPGVWAAGTGAGTSMHTIITAGDGAKVAINVISELNGERYVDHDVFKPTV
ncbi:FAD-dependent oxidoreductase [Paenibacillus marinisediminis]